MKQLEKPRTFISQWWSVEDCFRHCVAILNDWSTFSSGIQFGRLSSFFVGCRKFADHNVIAPILTINPEIYSFLNNSIVQCSFKSKQRTPAWENETTLKCRETLLLANESLIEICFIVSFYLKLYCSISMCAEGKALIWCVGRNLKANIGKDLHVKERVHR